MVDREGGDVGVVIGGNKVVGSGGCEDEMSVLGWGGGGGGVECIEVSLGYWELWKEKGFKM
jgi:hypothetical protein